MKNLKFAYNRYLYFYVSNMYWKYSDHILLSRWSFDSPLQCKYNRENGTFINFVLFCSYWIIINIVSVFSWCLLFLLLNQFCFCISYISIAYNQILVKRSSTSCREVSHNCFSASYIRIQLFLLPFLFISKIYYTKGEVFCLHRLYVMGRVFFSKNVVRSFIFIGEFLWN